MCGCASHRTNKSRHAEAAKAALRPSHMPQHDLAAYAMNPEQHRDQSETICEKDASSCRYKRSVCEWIDSHLVVSWLPRAARRCHETGGASYDNGKLASGWRSAKLQSLSQLRLSAVGAICVCQRCSIVLLPPVLFMAPISIHSREGERDHVTIQLLGEGHVRWFALLVLASTRMLVRSLLRYRSCRRVAASCVPLGFSRFYSPPRGVAHGWTRPQTGH